MKRIKDPELFVKFICLGILILIGIYFSSEIKAIPATELSPVITLTPTSTITPTPTLILVPTVTSTSIPTISPTPTQKVELPDVRELAIQEALERVQNTLELFKVGEVTLYNTYSEEELDLLFRVVEAEATDYCVMCKSHVASVIFNRLKAGWWGGDLKRSLLAKRQFEVITNGRYKKMNISDETILACEIAFDKDTAQGALFFDSTKGESWAHENQEYLFSDHAHWFYK